MHDSPDLEDLFSAGRADEPPRGAKRRVRNRIVGAAVTAAAATATSQAVASAATTSSGLALKLLIPLALTGAVTAGVVWQAAPDAAPTETDTAGEPTHGGSGAMPRSAARPSSVEPSSLELAPAEVVEDTASPTSDDTLPSARPSGTSSQAAPATAAPATAAPAPAAPETAARETARVSPRPSARAASDVPVATGLPAPSTASPRRRATRARRTPASRARALAHPASDEAPTLLEEARQLQRAVSASRRGDPAAALQILREYERIHPQGELRHEAAVARVVALCRAGQLEQAARERQSRLPPAVRRAFATRLNEVCGAQPE